MRYGKTHGESSPQTPRYQAWGAMMHRCYNPHNKRWKDYGGRGIRVCERWHKFESFRDDMGPHPGKGWTLDRIDNNGDYEPSNCQWSTQTEQQRNRSITKLTLPQAREIKRRRLAGEPLLALCQEFSICMATASNIAHGKLWA